MKLHVDVTSLQNTLLMDYIRVAEQMGVPIEIHDETGRIIGHIVPASAEGKSPATGVQISLDQLPKGLHIQAIEFKSVEAQRGVGKPVLAFGWLTPQQQDYWASLDRISREIQSEMPSGLNAIDLMREIRD